MALTDPTNTLAYHQSRVLTTHRDMRHVNCKQVGPAIAKFMAKDANPGTVPEAEACWFYGLNHGMALIGANRAAQEPLSPWELDYVTQYHAILGEKAVRAFYYLVLICTREFRHNQSLSQHASKIAEMFGSVNANWFKSIKGGESSIGNQFKSAPPDSTIGSYVEALRWGFYNCKWNGGYGGQKWGAVTDCLVSFVNGEYSAEMMLDTVWTLAHNGGPIFNKGQLYGMYGSTLYRLLDVQRAGQMPAGILHDPQITQYADPTLKKRMSELYERYPAELPKPYVDWEMVEALGAVKKYPHEKAEQAKKYGLSPEAQAAYELKNKAKIEQELAAKKAAEEYEKMHLTIMPGLKVKKFIPVRDAA